MRDGWLRALLWFCAQRHNDIPTRAPMLKARARPSLSGRHERDVIDFSSYRRRVDPRGSVPSNKRRP